MSPGHERFIKRALIVIALAGLAAGLVAWGLGRPDPAAWLWAAGTVPVVAGLAFAMARDLLAGRMGVDAVAFVSMTAALLLGQELAAAVVAVMYAGGNALEDFAIARAEHNLKSLIDRAPRTAHRLTDGTVTDVPVEEVATGDRLMVRAGEVIPVDGTIGSETALIDEAALTGEPVPVARRRGEVARSGTINAGETFELAATATSGESTYAGIIRLVAEAREARAPFIRLADRYGLILLPVSLIVAGGAWLLSGDPIRGLAVLVVATPCPLILAAPVAFIAGVSQAAGRGILIKGGGPLEALARATTVMFDKTGTLTVGGARLIAIETAPGASPDEVLRLAGSLELASHNVVAAAIVEAANDRGLTLTVPSDMREVMGSGIEGTVEGKKLRIGAFALAHGAKRPEDWAQRALRRAAWRSALAVFVSIDDVTTGALLLGDELRRETPRAVQLLRSAGIGRIVMVTGDRADSAETIGAALDIDAVLAERVPSDKVDAVRTEEHLHPTIMVGDGINDAPALAAASVGIAMGARGASASSEAADVVILIDRLDRVSDAVAIARRTRAIASQSILAGMALSAIAMGFAATGWLVPVAGALLQEVIDVAVIINALRALRPPYRLGRPAMPAGTALQLRQEHEAMEPALDRLREIADALDDADPQAAVQLIVEADLIAQRDILAHEESDERKVYPRLGKLLGDNHGLGAMSRAHREIMHIARLLSRLADGLKPEDADRYLVRDAQRAIESIEALVRVHNAQEEEIYEHAAAG